MTAPACPWCVDPLWGGGRAWHHSWGDALARGGFTVVPCAHRHWFHARQGVLDFVSVVQFTLDGSSLRAAITIAGYVREQLGEGGIVALIALGGGAALEPFVSEARERYYAERRP